MAFVAGCRSRTTPEKTPVVPTSLAQDAGREGERRLAVDASRLCVTSGSVEPIDATSFAVRVPGFRAFVAGDEGRTATVDFVYRGPTKTTSKLASGELRRQVGLKLRAQDACNVLYVMWHIEPTTGVFVSVKYNPGQSTHSMCSDHGYVTVKPVHGQPPKAPFPGERHSLSAAIEGDLLRVFADDVLAWEGALPPQALRIDGPAGIRTDNAELDVELRTPGGLAKASCPNVPAAGHDAIPSRR